MRKWASLILSLLWIFALPVSASNLAGNALFFDGIDAFVRIPDASHLDGMASLTIETWFCPLSSQGVNPIIWKSDGGNIYTDRSYELEFPNSHDQAYISFFSGTSGWTALKSEMQLVPNQWMHIVTTYDCINGTAQLYWSAPRNLIQFA